MPTSSPARVDERTARVAGVDGGVGLDEVFVVRDADVGASERGHDAQRHGLIELKRIADREYPFGHLQRARITPRNRREAARVDLEERQVGRRVDADNRGLDFALVGQRHRHRRKLPEGDAPGLAGDDVVVRQHKAVSAHDDPGAKASFDTAPLPEHVVAIAIEELEERIVRKRGVGPLDDLRRGDIHHGRDRALRDSRKVRHRDRSRGHAGRRRGHRGRRRRLSDHVLCPSQACGDDEAGGEPAGQEQHGKNEPSAVVMRYDTRTRRGFGSLAFGQVTVSTPSSRLATMRSASTGAGS